MADTDALQRASTEQKRNVPTGAISGVATEGPIGRPLSGVVISLLDGRAKVSLRTVTDSKGRFVFRSLPVSDGYVIQATKPGYDGSGLVRRSVFSPGSRLPLGDGEWIPDANITMWRLGGISGILVDEYGEPVVDVPVRVLARVSIAGTTHLAAGPASRTDDRGFYRIAGLRAGTYFVTVPSVQSVVPLSTPVATITGFSPGTGPLPGRELPRIAGLDIGDSWLMIGRYATPPPLAGWPQAYPVLFYPNSRSVNDAAPVELTHGEEKRNIDFALRPVPTARIAGRLTGPPAAVAGLVVRLLPDGSEALGEGSEQATALVDSEGTFTFARVPAGRYTLDARASISDLAVGRGGAVLPSAPGLISEQSTLVIIPSASGEMVFRTRHAKGQEAYSARLQLTVGSGDVSDLVLPLERGGTISGRIILETGSSPPRTVTVGVEPATGDPTLGRPRWNSVVGHDANGAFAVDGLLRGEYFLRVNAGALLVKSIVAAGDYTDRPFEAAPGTDVSGVLVTLTSRAAALSGAVRDAQGLAVNQGAVILFPAARTLWQRFGLEPPRIRAVTFFGRRGYQMTRLPAGEYYVIAVESAMQDVWHDSRFFDAAASTATRITLAWGASAVQDLTIQRVTVR